MREIGRKIQRAKQKGPDPETEAFASFPGGDLRVRFPAPTEQLWPLHRPQFMKLLQRSPFDKPLQGNPRSIEGTP